MIRYLFSQFARGQSGEDCVTRVALPPRSALFSLSFPQHQQLLLHHPSSLPSQPPWWFSSSKHQLFERQNSSITTMKTQPVEVRVQHSMASATSYRHNQITVLSQVQHGRKVIQILTEELLSSGTVCANL